MSPRFSSHPFISSCTGFTGTSAWICLYHFSSVASLSAWKTYFLPVRITSSFLKPAEPTTHTPMAAVTSMAYSTSSSAKSSSTSSDFIFQLSSPSSVSWHLKPRSMKPVPLITFILSSSSSTTAPPAPPLALGAKDFCEVIAS